MPEDGIWSSEDIDSWICGLLFLLAFTYGLFSLALTVWKVNGSEQIGEGEGNGEAEREKEREGDTQHTLR